MLDSSDMHHRRFFLSIGLLFFSGILPLSAPAQSEPQPYLQTLLQKAHDQQLDQDPYWHTLLHYRKRLLGGVKSEIDARGFFNAPDGRTEPQDELRQTLTRFFDPAGAASGLHSQCLFPDRYHWLKEKLAFDSSRLPEQPCREYQEWRAALNPESITLVFSAYYLNNPSSMFGHTLLRLNQSKHSSQERLLDYGVNYAANPTTTNAFLYGVLGMTGGFPGVFSNVPYYLKVQEYNDNESRDLWEYDLTFTPEQINRFMLHLWTVGHVQIAYYFFDKNCSYMILTLLDAANPELGLSDKFGSWWVIPADTVRVISKVPGLVKSVHVRPAIATRINRQLKNLNQVQNSLFRELIGNHEARAQAKTLADIKNRPSEEASAILDVSMDYLRMLKIRAKNKQTPEEESLQREVLVARSELPPGRPEIAISEQEMSRTRPDLGHETSRFSLGTGYNSQSRGYAELGWRASFHDLNAAYLGYPRFAEVELLDTELRYDPVLQSLRLERFDILNILSLTPFDSLYKKLSWGMKLDVVPVRDINCDQCLEGRFSVGAGLTFSPQQSVLIYALGKAEFAASFSSYLPRYRLGPVAATGAILDIADDLSLKLGAEYYQPILGFTSGYYQASAEGRISTSRNTDIRLQYDLFQTESQAGVVFNVYY